MQQPFIPVAARIAIEMNLFQHVVDKGEPITSLELATITGAEEELIGMYLNISTCSR
jgi:hypothetical protein